MTNEKLLEKMKEDMEMRNFSKYSFYTYYHKAEEMMRYFGKPMEEVTMERIKEIFNDVKRKRPSK